METPLRTRKRRVQIEVQKTLIKIRKSTMDSSPQIRNENSVVIDNEPLGVGRQINDEVIELNSEIESSTVVGFVSNSVQSRNLENAKQSKLEILAMWAKRHNIKHSALNELLITIRPWFPLEIFPKDSRTLLRTPRKVDSVEVDGGHLYHFGVSRCIKEALLSGYKAFRIPNLDNLQNIDNLITIKVGIDGVPLSKCSNLQFWPILCSVDQAVDSSVYLVSLFYGETKPLNIDTFLAPFVEEMMRLEQDGLICANIRYNIRIRCVIADAPARSFIKCIKNHNAYYGCERCDRKGKWSNRVTYPKSKIGSLYSDTGFIDQINPNHHDGYSPLIKLRLGMISQIPLDYMHLICLGVMKKLLLTWTIGPLIVRLGPKQILCISRRLISMKSSISSEFNRKCRSLKDLRHWKATEFRTFLLYAGPLALKGILSDKLFEHFMLLHCAIYILISDSAYDKEWVLYAGHLLKIFVSRIQELYFKEFYVFTVHTLLHLHLDVLKLGPLDNFSAFPFENGMQFLKSMIRMNRSHLSQVVRRVSENNGRTSNKQKHHFSGPLVKFSPKVGDNCFVEKNSSSVCVIISSISEHSFMCNEFRKKEIVPWYPVESSKLGVFLVSRPGHSKVIESKDILKKCLLFPYGDKYLSVPLIHG
jgi:hypothetical protein